MLHISTGISLLRSQNFEPLFFDNKLYGKKGAKWDTNYNFSEKTTMAIAAETVSSEDVIGKV